MSVWQAYFWRAYLEGNAVQGYFLVNSLYRRTTTSRVFCTVAFSQTSIQAFVFSAPHPWPSVYKLALSQYKPHLSSCQFTYNLLMIHLHMWIELTAHSI